MNAVDHYALVLSDLETQRDRIDIAIAAIRALQPGMHAKPLHINGIDEGEAPSGPAPKPFAIISEIAADPELLKLQANNLLDRGFSVGEVTRELNLTPDQATSFFQGR